MKAIIVFTAYFTHKARTCIYISSWTGRHRQLSDIELHTTYIYIYRTNFFLRSEELEERDARGERGVYTRTRSNDIGKEFGDRLGRYFVRRRVLRRSDFSAALCAFRIDVGFGRRRGRSAMRAIFMYRVQRPREN